MNREIHVRICESLGAETSPGLLDPKPHKYQNDGPDNNWGRRGGLGGMIYGGRWYCIETELKLNSVNAGDYSWVPDGILRTWIDGRLVYERTEMVFRTLPAKFVPDPNMNGNVQPIRELGVAWLLWNWYHGGTTESSVNRTYFMSGLVWARKRIGQMKIP